MGFSNIRHNSGQEIFKIKIEDTSGKFLENWVIMKCDFPNWVNLISKKYGITIKKPSSNKDLDWAL